MTTDTNAATAAMIQGRRADSARRRQRVLNALNDAVNNGQEISVSGIAHRAGVDRTFLYRHRDLLEHVHAAEAQPPNTTSMGPTVSRASLQADLIWRAACQVGMVKRCPRPSPWTPLRWPDGPVVTSVSGVDASSV